MSFASQVNNLSARIGQSVKAILAILDSKQDRLISGVSIKTLNSQSLLGSGDIAVDSVANLDGGSPTSNYGGISAIDGGSI